MGSARWFFCSSHLGSLKRSNQLREWGWNIQDGFTHTSSLLILARYLRGTARRLGPLLGSLGLCPRSLRAFPSPDYLLQVAKVQKLRSASCQAFLRLRPRTGTASLLYILLVKTSHRASQDPNRVGPERKFIGDQLGKLSWLFTNIEKRIKKYW